MKKDERETAWRLRKWLHGLLIATMLIATADITVKVVLSFDKASSKTLLNAVDLGIFTLDSVIFFAITVGLIYSSTLVIYRIRNLRSFKKQVIKDKCVMFFMTSVFTLSYLVRSSFMVYES